MHLTRITRLKLKLLIAVSLTIGFSACNSNSHKNQDGVIVTADTTVNAVKEDLLVEGSIKQLLSSNHNQLLNIHGDLNSFILYVNKLDDRKVSSIPFALDYINTCIPTTDTSSQDSVFLIFNTKFYSVANALTQRLDSQYKLVMSDIEKDSLTAASEIFKNNLSLCGIGIFSTEGNYYADVEPDYFYNNFKNKVIPATKEFLRIRKKEMEEGFSEDAGMLISFDSLYSRIKLWENFLNAYPNSLYYSEAENYYFTYLETLMTGMDNSRVFEGEDNILSPQIKLLYQKIMAEKPDSKATQLITAYYNSLAKENFRETDKVDSFLNKNHLHTMLGVEPHLR